MNIFFTNPLYLLLLPAIGIPIVIHFLSLQKYKNVEFPSLEFILSSYQKSIKQIKLQQILIMILRTLLILFLILAFTRPFIKLPAVGSKGLANVDYVMVLDNSYSMGYELLPDTTFAKAKKWLEKVVSYNLDNCRMNILLSQQPVPVFPKWQNDRNKVLEKIDKLSTSKRTRNLGPAIYKAAKMLESSSAAQKIIFVATDLQENSIPKDFPEIPAGVELIFLDPMANVSENVAITSISPPSFSVIGLGNLFSATISNFSEKNINNVVTNISIDNQMIKKQILSIPANSSKTITFSYTPLTATEHQGVIKISKDKLPIDNERTFSFKSSDKLSIIICDENTSDHPTKQESFFLRKTLSPGTTSSPFTIKYTASKNITTQNLLKTNVLVLASVTNLPPVNVLDNYLQQGGGLLVFLGNNVAKNTYNSTSFLPAKLERIASLGNGNFTSLTPSEKGFYNTNPSSVQIYKYYKTQKSANSSVIWRYKTGDPALLLKDYGKGKTLLFTSTASAAWNNFCLKPSFVPFIHESVLFLAQKESDKKTVGDQTKNESNLKKTDLIALKNKIKVPTYFVNNMEGIDDLLSTQPKNFSLVGWLLFLALLCFIGEFALTQQIRTDDQHN